MGVGVLQEQSQPTLGKAGDGQPSPSRRPVPGMTASPRQDDGRRPLPLLCVFPASVLFLCNALS